MGRLVLMRQAGRSLEDQQGSEGPDNERDDSQDVLLAGIRAAPNVERGLDNIQRGRPNVACSTEGLLGRAYGVPALSLMQCWVTFLLLLLGVMTTIVMLHYLPSASGADHIH